MQQNGGNNSQPVATLDLTPLQPNDSQPEGSTLGTVKVGNHNPNKLILVK